MQSLDSCRRQDASPGWKFRRSLGAAALSLVMTACGGGGGDDTGSKPVPIGPPGTPATLTASTTEAASLAQAASNGADNMAARSNAMSGLSLIFGGNIAKASAAVVALRLPHQVALADGRARRLATETVPCADFFDTAQCSGNAVADTSFDPQTSTVKAGDYIDIRFNALSGSLEGLNMLLNGRMRIEFLSALNLDSTTLTNIAMRITLDGFSGSVNGAAYGPISEAIDFRIDGAGKVTIDSGGSSYGDLGSVSVTGTGNYSIGTGQLRTGYGGGSTVYVDVSLQNWRNVNGRPVVGSTATLVAGAGSATVRVSSISATTVVFAVTVKPAGASAGSNYTVTATYPAGGGAPVFTAVTPG